MKRWSESNPKAALMEQKRSAIVAAARRAFLNAGYSLTSMDGIAELANVSVKTVYRHFENKDELFSAVMQAVCHDNGIPSGEQSIASLVVRYPWIEKASVQGLMAAGREYLDHVLSEEQLSLYRVVTQDANRFPQLGRRYQNEVVNSRTKMIAKYIEHYAQTNQRKLRNPRNAGNVFEALLRAGLFEEKLHGVRALDETDIVAHARTVANMMRKLIESEIL